jgi:tetratricopeptide (TPR) repeat protein
VLSEIKLMQAEAWAQEGNCSAAGSFIAAELPGMSRQGSAREYVKLAGIARSCGDAKQSEDLWRKAAAGTDAAGLVWAIKAEKALNTYDSVQANSQLAEALPAVESHIETSTFTGTWWYQLGTLQAALGRKQQASESFKRALLLSDNHMSHHLAREAMAEIAAGK